MLEHRDELKKHDRPTKVGIQFPVEILQRFKAGMMLCKDIIDKHMGDARRTYKEIKFFLVERGIRSTRNLSNECGDCKIDHESAVRQKKLENARTVNRGPTFHCICKRYKIDIFILNARKCKCFVAQSRHRRKPSVLSGLSI